jgi:ribosome-associated protein
MSALEQTVLAALDDMKAVNVQRLDVRGVTDIADTMIIASGTSDRHVRSISDRVIQKAKESGHRPMGVEGTRDSEWVLVDLQDVLVHVMLPRVREFYALEQLWEVPAAARRQEEAVAARPAPRKRPAVKAAPAPAPAKGGLRPRTPTGRPGHAAGRPGKPTGKAAARPPRKAPGAKPAR